MKDNKVILYTVFTLLACQFISHDTNQSNDSHPQRSPANILKDVKKMLSNTRSVVGKGVGKNPGEGLKEKIAETKEKVKLKFEDLKDKKDLILAKKEELKEVEEKEKQLDPQKISEESKNIIKEIICKSELKGEKLRAEIKALLKDQEAVLELILNLKEEQESLKEKLAQSKKSSEETKISNSLIKFLVTDSQNPTSVPENQFDMQFQMMNMLNQMQTFNRRPTFQPGLSFSPYNLANNQAYNFSSPNPFNRQYGIEDAFFMQPTPWSSYLAPNSFMPSLTRQQFAQDSSFSFQPPVFSAMMLGYNFNQ